MKSLDKIKMVIRRIMNWHLVTFADDKFLNRQKVFKNMQNHLI